MSGKTGLQMVKSILTEVYRVFAPKGVSDEVKTKVGAAIKHIAGI